MTLQTWLLFCVTETVLCLTPGPAVLLVLSTALTRGSRPGLRASLGILAANTLYFVLSATSLGALLQASGRLFTIVTWAGAAWLVWLGARMVITAWRRPETTPEDGSPAEAVPAPARVGAFTHGFVTQVANPKAYLFFAAILPQFVDPHSPVTPQIVVLGVSSVVIELGVLAAYVAACRPARTWASHPRVWAPLQAVGGALLMIAGARLAALS